MKKKIFGLGILAMVLVFGLAVLGCDNGDPTGNGNGIRWVAASHTWSDSSLTNNAIVFSVDSDGNVTATVNETSFRSWYIQLVAHYTAATNSIYRVTFDIRAREGEERTMMHFFWGVHGTTPENAIRTGFPVTTTWETHSFDLPRNAIIGDSFQGDFNLAYSTGTIYIRNISIIAIN